MKLIIDSEEILNDINIMRKHVEFTCGKEFKWSRTNIDTEDLISIVTVVPFDSYKLVSHLNKMSFINDEYKVMFTIEQDDDCYQLQITVDLLLNGILEHIEEHYPDTYND